MANPDNLALLVATYDDDTSAQRDFEDLRAAQVAGDFAILGAVVMDRNVEGDVHVHEHHLGEVGGGATAGGAIGLVVGLFSPPLLLATAVGAGIGAGIGALMKHSEERELSIDLEEYLPAGSSAVAVVAEDTYLDRIDRALTKSAKKVNKAIDSGDYDKLRDQLGKADVRISDAIDS